MINFVSLKKSLAINSEGFFFIICFVVAMAYKLIINSYSFRQRQCVVTQVSKAAKEAFS